jgi:hypothetical protein
MRHARRSRTPWVLSRELAVWRLAARLTTFFQYLPPHAVVQREFTDQSLQGGVLLLKSPQALGIRDVHATKFAAPAIERLLGAVVLTAHRAGVPHRLRFVQHPDDLFVWKSSLHRTRRLIGCHPHISTGTISGRQVNAGVGPWGVYPLAEAADMPFRRALAGLGYGAHEHRKFVQGVAGRLDHAMRRAPDGIPKENRCLHQECHIVGLGVRADAPQALPGQAMEGFGGQGWP